MIWTNRAVRALLAALYGGSEKAGLWYPNVKAAARYRRATPRTIARWYAGEPDEPSPIPVDRLRALLKGRRPTRLTRQRETIERARLIKTLGRAELGRGRGNLQEYDKRGWNDPHILAVIREQQSPLARPLVFRQGIDRLQERTRAHVILHQAVYPNRFAADLGRLEYLAAHDELRLRTRRLSTKSGSTQWYLHFDPVILIDQPPGRGWPLVAESARN